MIAEVWEQIKKDRDVRQNLSKLRQELKQNKSQAALLYQIAGEEQQLVELLKHEDAKTRKNAALLLGDLGLPEFLDPLYQAYTNEQQMFVKSAYLTAMKNFDYRKFLDDFKVRLEALTKAEMTDENRKHLSAEIKELSALIVTIEGMQMHPFTGTSKSYDIILLTNRNFPELTAEALQKLDAQAKTEVFGAGVMARVSNLKWINQLRTYSELLFVVKGMSGCAMDAGKAAATIVNSNLLKFLKQSHDGEPPFYFRVEFKSKMDLGKRSAFAKKLSGQIEKLSERKLINSTSNYEIEIRLIENKEGNLNLLVKLFTLKDERFIYRQETTPTSIRPVNAAITVDLAKAYMKEGAQVLDPFCGVGTMLIERHKAVKANTTYGIDLQAEAINKARQNTENAHQIIHYINRDFFDFKHEYLFDEIITDMPFRIGRVTDEEIYDLHVRFFQAAKAHLQKDAILILYSHNKEDVEKLAVKNGYRLQKTYEISKKEGTYVIVLQY